MPRLFRTKSPETPVAVSITSLNGLGKDNQAFVPENGSIFSPQTINAQNNGHLSSILDGNSHNGNGFLKAGTDHSVGNNGAISIISHDNVLTHRNAPKVTDSSGDIVVINGGAHPFASAGGAPNGNPPSTQSPASQPSAPSSSEAPKTDGVEMKKSINLLHMVAILVSVTGHSSIFIAPASILTQAGSVGGALVVWLVGGVIHLGQALCFAELGTMYPGAGGPYAYAMKAFGPLMGFLMMWGYTILIAGPFWAFLARTAAVYILRPVFPSCTTTDIETATTLLAGWIIGRRFIY